MKKEQGEKINTKIKSCILILIIKNDDWTELFPFVTDMFLSLLSFLFLPPLLSRFFPPASLTDYDDDDYYDYYYYYYYPPLSSPPPSSSLSPPQHFDLEPEPDPYPEPDPELAGGR